jgi:site-specific recombinase XerD
VWAGIRNLYRFLSDEEDIPDIAARIMVGRPATSDRVTHLDRREVGKLLRACRTPKEDAVIAVFLDTGARISEVAQLTVADVLVSDLRAGHLLVHGKGGKDRAVVIGASTAQALRRYLRERSRSRHADLPALWLGERGAMRASGLDKLIRDVASRAGLAGVHPHTLRHTWSHFYRLDGGQVDNMCYLAGWSGPAMALKYGRSAQAERAEAEARNLSLVDRQRGRSS